MQARKLTLKVTRPIDRKTRPTLRHRILSVSIGAGYAALLFLVSVPFSLASPDLIPNLNPTKNPLSSIPALAPPLETLSLKISEEIHETKLILEKTAPFCDDRTDCRELNALNQRYLEALENLKKSSQSEASVISGTFKASLLGTLFNPKPIFSFEPSLTELLRITQYIESHLPDWKKPHKPIPPLSISNEQGIPHLIYFLYVPSLNQLMIQTRLDPIGRGASKTVYEVFTYPHWQRLALGLPRLGFSNKKHSIENEQKIFQILAQSTHSNGLVNTVHVEPKFILQKAYTPLKSGSLNHLPLFTRLKLLEQVGEGLVSLHEKEICHGDIKEENLLLSGELGTPEELVLTDFDLSYSPRELLQAGKKRPFGGTLPFIAPELLANHFTFGISGWLDSEIPNSEKKMNQQIQAALKADVFSLANVASEILRPSEVQWHHGCYTIQRPFELWRCQQLHLPGYLYKLTQGPYQSIHQLLIAALNPNPLERIDSQQFLAAIQFLKNKAAPPTSSMKEQNRELTPFLRSIPNHLKIETIEGAFRLAKPGNYLLNWHPSRNRTRLIRFSFLDLDGQFLTYLWPFNPTQPDSISEEVEFLKKIGRIQGEPLTLKRSGG